MGDGPSRGTFTNYPSVSQVIAGAAPLLTVKLTIFENGGCALGLVANHIVFDGWTFATFMKDWSELHNGRQVPSTTPYPSAEMLRIPNADEAQSTATSKGFKCVAKGLLGKLALKVMLPLKLRFSLKAPLKRSVLHFTDQELTILKARAQAKAGTWVSTDEALLAHLHPLMLEVCGVPKDCWHCLGACIAVNLRGKLSGISPRTIGNVVCSGNCSYDLKDPTGGAALAVHEAMRRELTESELRRSIALWNHMFARSEVFMHETFKPGTPGYIHQWNYQATNPYYEVDFGAGRPDRALPWSFEAVKVMKGPRGGLDVMVHQGEGMGIRDWIRNPYRCLASGLGVAIVAIVGHIWWTRKTSSGRATGAHLGFGALLFALRRAIAHAHERRVRSCFIALENHPKLRSFTQEIGAFGA